MGALAVAGTDEGSVGPVDLPQVDLPSPFDTDNPFIYNQETGEEYGTVASGALESLIQTMSPTAKEKVQNAAQ